jgi:HK97 gp10 family phage protein
MAGELAGFGDTEYRKLMSKFDKMGGDVKDVLSQAVIYGAALVESKAKSAHFFLGTKRVSATEENESAYVFTNPDGSPRFRIRTAALINSIQMRDKQESGDEVSVSVAASQKYAKDVEDGGPGRRAFPFMRPAFEQSKAEIIKKAKDLVLARMEKWKQ